MADIQETYDIDPKTVQTFKDFGKFENNIDEFGNFQIIKTLSGDVSGNLCYAMLTLKTFSYDESQILDNEKLEFVEFETTSRQEEQNVQNMVEQYNSLITENRVLNDTINSLIEKYENNDNETVIKSMKEKIVDLRIQLGQGQSINDFDEDFPFLPTQ